MARRKKKDDNASSIKVIKRYGNRKLYDTQQSCYVTLEGISHMVRKGEDLKVVDNKTGEDLTTIILAQIMLEEEKSKKNALPLSLMKNLIQQSGESHESVLIFAIRAVLECLISHFFPFFGIGVNKPAGFHAKGFLKGKIFFPIMPAGYQFRVQGKFIDHC